MGLLGTKGRPMKPATSDLPSPAALRRRNRWTQAELARLLGVDTATVSRWERGGSRPRASQRAALARLADSPSPEAPIESESVASGPSPGRFSRHESIDELVRIVGLDRARLALRALALQARPPEPLRLPVDPTGRMLELDEMLAEQRALNARARIR
jgi:transcriptional regulator with XRE-family HTH domain